jgi:hypothetical protein
MCNRIVSLTIIVMLMCPCLLKAQDSIKVFNLHEEPPAKKSFGSTLIVPGILIGYGAASLVLHPLKQINAHFNEETYLENPHKAFHLDNYLIYAPTAMVYGLNMIGIKGKNNFVDRSAIVLISNVIMSGTVFVTKDLTHEWRPDRSDHYSFPSGHTATAFVAAEFMRREYKDVSVWYGVAGYAMAAATGYLRMYNNKHWLGDVVAGAGVGILSTDIAYYIYPSIKKVFTKKKTDGLTMILPTYQQGNIGASFINIF